MHGKVGAIWSLRDGKLKFSVGAAGISYENSPPNPASGVSVSKIGALS